MVNNPWFAADQVVRSFDVDREVIRLGSHSLMAGDPFQLDDYFKTNKIKHHKSRHSQTLSQCYGLLWNVSYKQIRTATDHTTNNNMCRVGGSPAICCVVFCFKYRYQVSGIRYQVPGIRYQGVTRYQVPGLRSQVSGIRYQVSGIRYQVPGTRSQVSGTRSQVSGTRYQISGKKSNQGSLVRCLQHNFEIIRISNALRSFRRGSLAFD